MNNIYVNPFKISELFSSYGWIWSDINYLPEWNRHGRWGHFRTRWRKRIRIILGVDLVSNWKCQNTAHAELASIEYFFYNGKNLSLKNLLNLNAVYYNVCNRVLFLFISSSKITIYFRGYELAHASPSMQQYLIILCLRIFLAKNCTLPNNKNSTLESTKLVVRKQK